MTIKERFPDYLISSTNLTPEQVPGLLQVAQKGPIKAEVGLDKIVDSIHVNLAKAKLNASHARPSMLANLSSFVDNVKLALEKACAVNGQILFSRLDDPIKEDFAEWCGMIAAVALNDMFSGTGLDLSVQPVSLNSADPVQRCVLFEMDKDKVYQKAVEKDAVTGELFSGMLYYICQNGSPFAVYHPEIGMCAMKVYDSGLFEGVLNWNRNISTDCHKRWLPIFAPNAKNTGWITSLNDTCLSRIAWWAKNNGMIAFSQFVHNCQNDKTHVCDPILKSDSFIKNSNNIDNIPAWAGKGTAFGTSIQFSKQRIPQLFNDDIFVSYIREMDDEENVQKKNCLIYNTHEGVKRIEFKDSPVDLQDYVPVAPLKQTVMELLDYGCTLENITFEATINDHKLGSITVTVEISNAFGEVFPISKIYTTDHIFQGAIPYLMVWPYLPLPVDQEPLSQYYATWQDTVNEDGIRMLESIDGSKICNITEFDFDFGSQGEIDRIFAHTNPNDAWPVCRGNRMFRYASLKGMRGKEKLNLGTIFIPELPRYDDLTSVPIDLAIDFGTTSTVVAFSCAIAGNNLGAGASTPLPFLDYSKTVTVENYLSNGAAQKKVAVEHWLGNEVFGSDWEHSHKIFSVAQLFERKKNALDLDRLPAGNQAYYLDGRMFIVSPASMAMYADKLKGSNDPLRDQWIMNDMKFNESPDIKNFHAASIYLAGIYTYAVLYFLKNHADPGRIKLMVSYPNDVTLDALNTSWNYAKDVLSKMLTPALTFPVENLLNSPSSFVNEAVATAAYHRRPNHSLAFVPTLITMDIGGGTTDISITNQNQRDKVKKVSVRYAGREIMVSSIIEYFRRFAPNASFDRNDMFRNLWNQPQGSNEHQKDGLNTLFNQFNELCKTTEVNGIGTDFLCGLTTNSSLRMNVELLLSQGMTMKPTALSNELDLLRQLIALKFMMVLQIAAKAVCENFDILIDNGRTEPDLIGNKLQLNLSVSGTSAQLMAYVLDCNISDLQGPASYSRNDKIMSCLTAMEVLFNSELKDKLPKGASVKLNIYIDKDIKEKREVCYGLLEIARNGTAYPFAARARMSADDVRGALSGIKTSDAESDIKMTDQEREFRRMQVENEIRGFDQRKLKVYLKGSGSGIDRKNGILDYLKVYEQIVFHAGGGLDRGLGKNIQVLSKLLDDESKYVNSFLTSRMAVAKSRAQYMVEWEQEEYREILTCMYIVDEILNYEFARHQC